MVARNVINNVIPNKEFSLIYKFAILLAIMHFGRMVLGDIGRILKVKLNKKICSFLCNVLFYIYCFKCAKNRNKQIT
jgi:hypothetical protein